MIKKNIIVSIAIIFGAVSLPAFAIMSKSSGFYYGLAMGQARIKDGHPGAKEKLPWAGGVGDFGYKFRTRPDIGFEIGAAYLPKVNYTAGKANYYFVDAALKTGANLYKRLNIFAKGGMARYTRSGSYDGGNINKSIYTPYADIGMGLVFSRHTNVSIEGAYLVGQKSLPQVIMVMVGFNYLF